MVSARQGSKALVTSSPNKHTNSATIQKLCLSEESRNELKGSCAPKNTKPYSLKSVKRFRTPSHGSPCTWQSTPWSGGNPLPCLAQGKAEVGYTSSTPTFPRGLPRRLAFILSVLELWQAWHSSLLREKQDTAAWAAWCLRPSPCLVQSKWIKKSLPVVNCL